MKAEEPSQKNAPKKWNDKFMAAGSYEKKDNIKHNKS